MRGLGAGLGVSRGLGRVKARRGMRKVIRAMFRVRVAAGRVRLGAAFWRRKGAKFAMERWLERVRVGGRVRVGARWAVRHWLRGVLKRWRGRVRERVRVRVAADLARYPNPSRNLNPKPNPTRQPNPTRLRCPLFCRHYLQRLVDRVRGRVASTDAMETAAGARGWRGLGVGFRGWRGYLNSRVREKSSYARGRRWGKMR